MAKQFNFSDIDELKKYAESMKTSIPENISNMLNRKTFNDNYKIYGESYNDFINIGTFYMNSYVKDSMYLDNVEYEDSEFGKKFKDYMIKYYDQGLTNNEIKDLLIGIMDYNEKVIDKVNKAPILYLFNANNGPYDFLHALLNDIKERLKAQYKDNTAMLNKVEEYFGLFNRAEYQVVKHILNGFKNFRVGVGLNSTSEFFSNIEENEEEATSGFFDEVYEEKSVEDGLLEAKEHFRSVKVDGRELLAYEKYVNAENKPDYRKIDFRKKYNYTYLYNKKFNKENTIRMFDSITTYEIDDVIIDDPENTKNRDDADLLYYIDIDEKTKLIEYKDSEKKTHRFYRTTSINTFLDDNGKAIETAVINLLENEELYGKYIRYYLNAKINSMKILYEIEESKRSATKLVASYEEANEIYKYDLATPINLMAVSLTDNERNDPDWKTIIKNDDDFRQITYLQVRNDEQIVNKLDIGIIYKELNPNYREVLLSDYVDYMIGVLSCYNYLLVSPYSNLPLLINPDIDELLRDMKVANNFFLLYDKEVLKSVINLYANNYLARKSSELEIIRYFADYQREDKDLAVIGFGSRSSDKDEIYSFLDIYNSVRHYYFTRLLNKAFINDTYYVPFEKFFFGLVAIERFISARISNMRNIDKFTEEDVHNFLLSYGLKSIDESAVFSSQIEYKKDIIKNYNTLMKSKGSLKCLNKLYEIFTSRTDGLNLSRYYLVNNHSANSDDPSDHGKMVFIPCSYSSDNLTKELFINLEKGKEYEELVNNDNYWDKVTLTEEYLTEKQVDVIPTKYNLLDLIEDIRSKYITTQYITSLIDIIQKTLRKGTGDATSIFESHFKIEDDDALGGDTRNLNEYLTILLDLFSIYNSYYYQKFTHKITRPTGSKFYGFNLDAIDGLSNNKYLKKEMLMANGKPVVHNNKNYYIFSLKEEFFKEINMPVTGDPKIISSAGLLQNYLIGLNLLYLLQQTKDDLNEERTGPSNNSEIIGYYCRTIDKNSSNTFEISNANLSNIIFKNILLFPVDYLNGLQVPENDKYIDDDFMEFTTTLFETIYNTSNTLYSINITNPDNDRTVKISEKTASVINSLFPEIKVVDNDVTISTVDGHLNDIGALIIKMSDNITNILNMDGKIFNLGLSIDSANLLKFLVESFKIFFSYTSELSETGNIWEYDSPSEYCSPYDYIKSDATYSLVDTNQYDEELIIIKQ